MSHIRRLSASNTQAPKSVSACNRLAKAPRIPTRTTTGCNHSVRPRRPALLRPLLALQAQSLSLRRAPCQLARTFSQARALLRSLALPLPSRQLATRRSEQACLMDRHRISRCRAAGLIAFRRSMSLTQKHCALATWGRLCLAASRLAAPRTIRKPTRDGLSRSAWEALAARALLRAPLLQCPCPQPRAL